MRKSKYDDFIFYDVKKDKILHVCWDCAWSGVSQWFHYDGKESWHEKGNDYLKKANKKYELIDRLPERSLWAH